MEPKIIDIECSNRFYKQGLIKEYQAGLYDWNKTYIIKDKLYLFCKEHAFFIQPFRGNEKNYIHKGCKSCMLVIKNKEKELKREKQRNSKPKIKKILPVLPKPKENTKICVYTHVNKINKEVFYVGIGTEKRPTDKKGRNEFWHEYVKLNEYEVNVIYKDLSCKEAVAIERKLIAEIGRKDKGSGTLLNLTNGEQWSCKPEHDYRKDFTDFLLDYPLINSIVEKKFKPFNFKIHSTYLHLNCNYCSHKWTQKPDSLIKRFLNINNSKDVKLAEENRKLKCENLSWFKSQLDRYMCNVCFPLEGFKDNYEFSPHHKDKNIVKCTNINKEYFERRKKSILQEKTKPLMKCYTVRNFKLIDDNTFSFNITKLINKKVFMDEKTYYAKYFYQENTNELFLEKIEL